MEAQRTLILEPRVEPAKPLLKWAGGKTQLLRVLRDAMPKKFNRYAEPFLGGGALFFDLAIPGSIVGDSNPELIGFYEVVRDCPDLLLEAAGDIEVSEDNYYRIRSVDPECLDRVRRAARFAYLNKTCYNGLHRVNRKGQFNTPFGGRTNVTVLDTDNVYKASRILRDTELLCAGYPGILRQLERGDFVYLDPPYMPLGGYSDFRRYTRDFFGEEDHVSLAKAFHSLTERGVKALLSNSSNPKTELLYAQYPKLRVEASRYINCKPEGRGRITELLVANYPLE